MSRAQAETRSTAEVLDEHLHLREIGDVEADLERNYSPDVVLICEPAVLRGRQAVHESALRLAWQIPDAHFTYSSKRVEGEYAFIVWDAHSPEGRVHHGVDSFVIRGGRIVMQSIYYRVRPAEVRA